MLPIAVFASVLLTPGYMNVVYVPLMAWVLAMTAYALGISYGYA